MSSPGSAINVLYIMSANRSGSTALERFLSSHEGTAVVGESRYVWTRGFDDERLCSCTVPLKECPFWQDVRRRAFGPTGPWPEAVGELTHSVGRIRYVPMMHHRIIRTPTFKHGFETSRKLVGRLYAAMAEAVAGRLIIDSSKVPSYAHMLSTIPEVRVAYVHLVRDSRAVAYSHGRERVAPEVHWARATLPRRGVARSSAIWDVRFASSLALIPYARKAVLQIRYEDFAADPSGTAGKVQQLLRELDMPPLGSTRSDADPAWYHSVQGNPMRFERGFSVRLDDEWKRAMPRRTKLLVGALTFPLLALHRYGVGFD